MLPPFSFVDDLARTEQDAIRQSPDYFPPAAERRRPSWARKDVDPELCQCPPAGHHSGCPYAREA